MKNLINERILGLLHSIALEYCIVQLYCIVKRKK